jgi:quinoprotein dehydrogenase-associated probable ABC transporter substrate-binding protein
MSMKCKNAVAYTLAIAVVIAAAGSPAVAEPEAVPPRTALKVCADPNAMPASNEKQEGFENKIAAVFADSLGLPLEFYWFPQRFKFLRNSLKKENPDGSFACDLVMSVPEQFDMAATTKPYYRSTWAMVYVKGRGLDDVKTPKDLINLSEERKKKLRLGLYDRGPATDWAFKHDLFENMVPYQHMTADLADYPGRIIDQDLVQGKIDVTFEWGPIAGYMSRKIKDAEIVVIPMQSEPGIQFDFTFSMAVRYGEKEWKQQINDLIDKHREDISTIFAEYGVPLLAVDTGKQAAADDDDEGKDDDDGPADDAAPPEATSTGEAGK